MSCRAGWVCGELRVRPVLGAAAAEPARRGGKVPEGSVGSPGEQGAAGLREGMSGGCGSVLRLALVHACR